MRNPQLRRHARRTGWNREAGLGIKCHTPTDKSGGLDFGSRSTSGRADLTNWTTRLEEYHRLKHAQRLFSSDNTANTGQISCLAELHPPGKSVSMPPVSFVIITLLGISKTTRKIPGAGRGGLLCLGTFIAQRCPLRPKDNDATRFFDRAFPPDRHQTLGVTIVGGHLVESIPELRVSLPSKGSRSLARDLEFGVRASGCAYVQTRPDHCLCSAQPCRQSKSHSSKKPGEYRGAGRISLLGTQSEANLRYKIDDEPRTFR